MNGIYKMIKDSGFNEDTQNSLIDFADFTYSEYANSGYTQAKSIRYTRCDVMMYIMKLGEE